MNDPSLLESLHQEYHHKLYFYFLRRLPAGSYEDAEDMAQEVLFKCWLHFDDLQNHQAKDGWIFRIAKNHILDWFRHRKIVTFESLDMTMIDSEDGNLRVDNLVEDSQRYCPPVQAMRSELIDDVRKVIQTLSGDHKQVIWLRHYLELDIHETAKILGVAEGTVKSRLSRAVSVMREKLAPSAV